MTAGAKIGKLTIKQKRFAEEYLVDLNSAAAIQRAGYKVKPQHAGKLGHRTLQSPAVQEYIAELTAERSKRTQITADRVLEEIAKVAFVNIADFIDDDGRMLPPGNINRENMATVQELTERVYGGDENPIVERKYKLNDKMNALEKLGKHLKLFTDKVETEVTHKGSIADLLAQVVDE